LSVAAEIRDQPPRDDVRDDELVIQRLELDLTRLVVEEGIVEEDRRMKVHPMGGQIGDEQVHRPAVLEQVHRAVADAEAVAQLVEVPAVVADDRVERPTQPGQGGAADVEDEQRRNRSGPPPLSRARRTSVARGQIRE
jgi:hypothetical protein